MQCALQHTGQPLKENPFYISSLIFQAGRPRQPTRKRYPKPIGQALVSSWLNQTPLAEDEPSNLARGVLRLSLTTIPKSQRKKVQLAGIYQAVVSLNRALLARRILAVKKQAICPVFRYNRAAVSTWTFRR